MMNHHDRLLTADELWGHYFKAAVAEGEDRHQLVERFAKDHATFGYKKPALRRFAWAILNRHCPRSADPPSKKVHMREMASS